MANEVLSAAILMTFVGLTLVGALSTFARVMRYRRHGDPQPLLLGRDRDLLLGLAIPFAIIGTVRAFELQAHVLDVNGVPQIWYLLLTGLPPIYAMARYCYFELFVIERTRNPNVPETQDQREDRQFGEERRSLEQEHLDAAD